MGLIQTAAPATEPVTLAEAKSHLRVDGTDDDTLITELIKGARQLVEGNTGRSLITQTWRLTLDRFPRNDEAIRLERPPLVSVESVTYVDTNGATQTMATSDYIVDTSHVQGEVALAYDKTWPDARAQQNAVLVNYTAGYGAASAVPEALKAAIKLRLGDLYENREASVIGTIHTANPAADALEAIYAVRAFA